MMWTGNTVPIRIEIRFWIITSCPYFIIWEVLLAITR